MIRLAGVGAAVLLVALAAYTGLWASAWPSSWVAVVVGLAHGLAMIGLAQWTLGDVHRTPSGDLPPMPIVGPADFVTMIRSMLGSLCLAVVVLAAGAHVPVSSWWLVGAAVPALVLDAVDGPLARRSGTARPAGGRYDMECDAMVLMILSLGAALEFGWWVVLIGLMRYLFGVAQRFVPRLRGRLAFSQFRRWVAGFQGAAVVAALAPVVPHSVGVVLIGIALAALVVSFGRDALGLLRTP